MATIPYPPAPELLVRRRSGRQALPQSLPAAAEPSPRLILHASSAQLVRRRYRGLGQHGAVVVLHRQAPRKIYILHNDATGQTIVIDKSTLLGRKPSMDVPEAPRPRRSRIRRVPHRAIMPRSASIRTARCGSRTTVPSTAPTSSATAGSAGAQGQAARTRRPPPRCVSETSLPTHRAPVATLHCPSCEISSGESPIQRRKTGL